MLLHLGGNHPALRGSICRSRTPYGGTVGSRDRLGGDLGERQASGVRLPAFSLRKEVGAQHLRQTAARRVPAAVRTPLPAAARPAARTGRRRQRGPADGAVRWRHRSAALQAITLILGRQPGALPPPARPGLGFLRGVGRLVWGANLSDAEGGRSTVLATRPPAFHLPPEGGRFPRVSGSRERQVSPPLPHRGNRSSAITTQTIRLPRQDLYAGRGKRASPYRVTDGDDPALLHSASGPAAPGADLASR